MQHPPHGSDNGITGFSFAGGTLLYPCRPQPPSSGRRVYYRLSPGGESLLDLFGEMEDVSEEQR